MLLHIIILIHNIAVFLDVTNVWLVRSTNVYIRNAAVLIVSVTAAAVPVDAGLQCDWVALLMVRMKGTGCRIYVIRII